MFISGIEYINVQNAQNPLDSFPHNFPVDGKVANLLEIC